MGHYSVAIQPMYGTVQRDVPFVAVPPPDCVEYSPLYMPPPAHHLPFVTGRSAAGGAVLTEYTGPVSSYGAAMVELPDVNRGYHPLLLRSIQLSQFCAGGTPPASRGLGRYHFDADELAILSLVSLFSNRVQPIYSLHCFAFLQDSRGWFSGPGEQGSLNGLPAEGPSVVPLPSAGKHTYFLLSTLLTGYGPSLLFQSFRPRSMRPME